MLLIPACFVFFFAPIAMAAYYIIRDIADR